MALVPSARVRVTLFLAGTLLALALLSSTASANVVKGPDPGQLIGVFPVHQAASKNSPIGGKPVESKPLAYQGGAVMHATALYSIFWAVPGHPFPTGYETAVKAFLANVVAESGFNVDQYSVDTQYCDSTAAVPVATGATSCPAGADHITGTLTSPGTYDDTVAPPPTDTTNCTQPAPCITDTQLQSEIQRVVGLNGWPEDPASAPAHQYLMFLPPGVNTCDAAGSCNETAFCAYHSSFQDTGTGNWLVYANLPYSTDCGPPETPGGQTPAEASIFDDTTHETNEAITDPLTNGTYAWIDMTSAVGNSVQEIADKCTNNISFGSDAYGLPLGGPQGGLFEEDINGTDYYSQEMWSNEATQSPLPTAGSLAAAIPEPPGCAERLGPTPQFVPPASPRVGIPVSFDGSASYDLADPISSYAWGFGDGTTGATATATHTYATAGTKTATLKTTDTTGATNAQTETRSIDVIARNQVLISQVHLSGGDDWFAELYNPGTTAVNISNWSLVDYPDTPISATSPTPQQNQFVPPSFLPAGTTIAANSYYLIAGSAYSGASTADVQASPGDPVPSDAAVDLLDSTGNVLDSVNFNQTVSNGNIEPYVNYGDQGIGEGATLGTFTPSPSADEYSFVRLLHTGLNNGIGFSGSPQDTENNAADFALVRPEHDTATPTNVTAYDGSPWAHSSTSNTILNNHLGISLLEPAQSASYVGNRQVVASGPGQGTASQTLLIRRTLTNNTGAPITALQFRITELTTGEKTTAGAGPPAGQAILHAVSDTTASYTDPSTSVVYPLTPMTLDAPANNATLNPDGGGLNASLTATGISATTPWANGTSINVEFKLGVLRGGSFAFYFNTEGQG